MLGPSEDIALVSYRGGTFCLPARSPYDRDLLAEEVLRECHLHDTVQVLLNDERWLVRRLGQSRRVACAQCCRLTGATCHSAARGTASFCVGCAVGHTAPVAHTHPRSLKAAS